MRANEISTIMANKAILLKTTVSSIISLEENHNTFSAIKSSLEEHLHTILTVDQFADLYAQLVAYGLFIARCSCENQEEVNAFSREKAPELIPQSHPFLRTFFDHIAGINFDKRLAVIVNELCTIFRISDLVTILDQHHTLTGIEDEQLYKHDPIIHFYEDFLQEYDPVLRQQMGAYYTPVPVVQFIIRSIDRILVEDFAITDGLASDDRTTYSIDTGQDLRKDKRRKLQTTMEVTEHLVQILDPATGTGTFLNEVINYIHTKFENQQGLWKGYVAENLLPRLYGFELMMAPYTVAHLKLGMTLQETGCDNHSERINVFLTNSLEEGMNITPDLFTIGLIEAMSEESRRASEVKNEKPVMIVLGNPPWKGESSNVTKYATSLVEEYKYEPGGTIKLQERNPKWINDDYVKFIAFAEKMITKNRSGIMGMITNNGYLDNPTFRGMRWHLRKTFDALYIVNLHGSAKIREKNVDGGVDQNIFNIQQGNSIIIAIKNPAKQNDLAKVFYADIYGRRGDKFSALDKDAISYQELDVDSLFHAFIPVNNPQLHKEYYNFPCILDLFNKGSLGFQTHRDHFAIAFTPKEMLERMKDFSNHDLSGFIQEKYGLKDNRDWDLHQWRNKSRDLDLSVSDISQVAYRPFDVRYTFYNEIISDRPRTLLADHVDGKDNLVLGVGKRGNAVYGQWSLVTISHNPMDANIFRRGGVQCFPLYVYTPDGMKVSNLNEKAVKKLCSTLDSKPSENDIIEYIYGLLHHLGYREKYAEFLAIDYPRIIPPGSQEEFNFIKDKGKELIELHLFKKKIPSTIGFPASGSNIIECVTYKEDETAWINDDQYFTGITQDIWNFIIGGYPVAKHWLTDRKDLTLVYGDIQHYLQLIAVIEKTIQIQQELQACFI